MSIDGEFSAQMFLISKETGADLSQSTDFGLGLDLNDVFDTYDWSMYKSSTDLAMSDSLSGMELTNASANDNESASFLIDDLINNFETTEQTSQGPVGCSFDELDFNLLEDVLDAVGAGPEKTVAVGHHHHHQHSSSFSLLDSVISSPSAEITYGNVYSIGGQSEDDSASQMSSSILSPAYSITAETVTTTDTKKMRKTRAKVIDKKESNKAAANRYRSKKLKEREELFVECELYAKKNSDMRKKIFDCQSEISFIKSLLVEALITKNGLKK